MILLNFNRYLCHDEFLTVEGACHLQEKRGYQGVKASYFQQNVCDCAHVHVHTHLWLDGRLKSVYEASQRVLVHMRDFADMQKVCMHKRQIQYNALHLCVGVSLLTWLVCSQYCNVCVRRRRGMTK